MNTSQQAYTLEFENRPRYAYGRLTASAMTIENADRYLAEIVDECTRLRTDGLLIERRVRTVLTRVLAYHKISRMVDTVPAGTAIAIVESDPMARDRFEWAIGHNFFHSLSFKVFATVVEAEKWLLSRGDGGLGGRSHSSQKPSAGKGPLGGRQSRGKHTLRFLLAIAFRPPVRSFTGH